MIATAKEKLADALKSICLDPHAIGLASSRPDRMRQTLSRLKATVGPIAHPDAKTRLAIREAKEKKIFSSIDLLLSVSDNELREAMEMVGGEEITAGLESVDEVVALRVENRKLAVSLQQARNDVEAQQNRAEVLSAELFRQNYNQFVVSKTDLLFAPLDIKGEEIYEVVMLVDMQERVFFTIITADEDGGDWYASCKVCYVDSGGFVWGKDVDNRYKQDRGHQIREAMINKISSMVKEEDYHSLLDQPIGQIAGFLDLARIHREAVEPAHIPHSLDESEGYSVAEMLPESLLSDRQYLGPAGIYRGPYPFGINPKEREAYLDRGIGEDYYPLTMIAVSPTRLEGEKGRVMVVSMAIDSFLL